MGLGFFIAKTLLERSGATLALANRPHPRPERWSRSLAESRDSSMSEEAQFRARTCGL